MAYTKTNWQTGDVIDATKLNHAEDGIAQAQQTADTANARDTLGELTDVEITNPTDGQAVLYDATNSKWVNGSAGGEDYLDVYDVQHFTLTKTVQELLQLIEDGKKLCIIVPSSKTTADGRSIAKGTYLFTEYRNLGNYNFIFSGAVFSESFTTEKPSYTGMGPILSNNYPIRITTPLHNNDVIMLKNSYPYYWYNATVSLDKLSDIQLTSPTNDQVLRYNGSKWVNGPATSISMAHLTYYKDDNGDYGDAGVMYMAWASTPSDVPNILDTDGLVSFLTQSVCTGIGIYDTTTMDGSRLGSTTSITVIESTGDVYVGDSHLSNHYKADGSGRLVLQTT